MARPLYENRGDVRSPKTFTIKKKNQETLKIVSDFLEQSESETINQLIETHAKSLRARNTEPNYTSTK